MSAARNFTRPVMTNIVSHFTGLINCVAHNHAAQLQKMYYVVYIIEDEKDKSWYIGFTSNLKERIKNHNSGKSPYTSRKKGWMLIYAEMYLDKKDALGRELFLKSGSGRKFLKKQLRNYLTQPFDHRPPSKQSNKSSPSESH